MRGVPPYLIPDPATVALGQWHIDLGTGPVPLPAFLPDWDSSTDLQLTRTVDIDIERVKAQSALPAGAELMLVIEWASSGARISGLAYRGEITLSAPWSLSIKLGGDRLAGALSLITRIVLARDLDSPAFTAAHAGDALAEEVTHTRLHGAAGRMPTYVVDFEQAGFDPDARWHLHVSHDLTEPVLAGLRLYLNARDGELVSAAQNAAQPTPVQKRILAWLESDVACQLVEHALHPDRRENVTDHLGDVDSIGGSLAGLIVNLFPGESPTALGALHDNDPGLLRTRAQGAARRMRSNHDNALSPTV